MAEETEKPTYTGRAAMKIVQDLSEKVRKVEERLASSIRALETRPRRRDQASKDLAVNGWDQAVKERDLAPKEKDQAVKEMDQAVKETDQAVKEREQAVKETDQAVKEREQAVKERDQAVNERDLAFMERDLTAEMRDQAVKERDRAKAENERLKKVLFSNKTVPVYQMSHSPKGVCLIINNINFRGLPSRTEAEADTGRLANVFRGFGFKVVTLQDLDHSKMVDVMIRQGEDDHSGYDCFVCCIMSHGTTGKVFSSNDVGIDILELIKPLNAKRCKTLKGKPKLFFIQACQGERHQSPERTDSVFDVAVTSTFIAKEADIFYGLATVPGYTAIRHDYGAPYVHHLACTLTKYGKTHDLLTMMTMVNDNMNASEQGRLVSSHHSTLRKKVYLCGTV
ncbi:caspase-3-like isoform X2 [Branchiostoma floridae x Branchiostoma belcheri]